MVTVATPSATSTSTSSIGSSSSSGRYSATMILDRFDLSGHVAIVTGAGKGIGAGCAVALAEAGADIVLAARTASDLDAVGALVEAEGRRALAVPTDVTDSDQLAALVTSAGELGRVTVLVNNAGGWDPRPVMSTSVRNMEA